MKRPHLIAGGLFFGVFFLYAGVNGRRTVEVLLRSASEGWLALPRDESVVVGLVRPGGPAEGSLRAGDEVLALNGHGVRHFLEVREAFERLPAGASYRILLRRDGGLRLLTLPTQPYGLTWGTLHLLVPALVSALFLLSGFVVFLVKPHDKQARLLALMFSLFIPGSAFYSPADLPAWVAAILVVVSLASSFFWPVFLHFFLVFPEPSPLVRRWPRVERLPYLPILGLLPALAMFLILWVVDPYVAYALATGSPAFRWAFQGLGLLYVAAGLASLILNYRQASRSARGRLRVVVAGSLAGFLPLLAASILFNVADITKLNETLVRLLWALAFLSLPLVPFSFAYAIVRHQVIPVRIIVRRGIRYLLVARGFILVEIAVLAAVMAFLLTGSRGRALDRLGPRADIAVASSAGGLVLAFLTLLHRRVMPRIDRRFFREDYDAQKVLADLGQGVRTAASIEEALELGVGLVRAALHPESAGVFLLDEASGDYCCAIADDGCAMPPLEAGSPVVERLRSSPLAVDAQGGGVLVPIVTKGDLLGILSVGPRLGDMPFTREDREMLHAVAWQMAFALENQRLVHHLVEKERLRREIAIASEVQRRLFPERPPESGRLELAGVCHPAQGVGGDYYDFLELGEGQIGIAVADVVGKGISAALLMSIVQASLRSQARSGPPSLPELVASMNRLLYRSTARNTFASFFYGQFDEESGAFSYVNAGHNPPILLRARNGRDSGPSAALARGLSVGGGGAVLALAEAEAELDVLLLRTGGLVIGAVDGSCYEQETVQLQAGDLLVAYTDGVTEAWSPEGEEFGESRLIGTVAAGRHLSAEALQQRIVSRVRAWSRDGPQYDDITVVVARVH